MNIINNLYRLDTPLSPAANAPGKPGSTAAATPEGAIRLSELSSQLQRLESSLSSEPVFDAARVEQIKTEIRDGNYRINAEAVADKVIQSIHELSGLKSHRGNA
jgi:negative regulator of flagellin synthesis FlgM